MAKHEDKESADQQRRLDVIELSFGVRLEPLVDGNGTEESQLNECRLEYCIGREKQLGNNNHKFPSHDRHFIPLSPRSIP